MKAYLAKATAFYFYKDLVLKIMWKMAYKDVGHNTAGRAAPAQGRLRPQGAAATNRRKNTWESTWKTDQPSGRRRDRMYGGKTEQQEQHSCF